MRAVVGVLLVAMLLVCGCTDESQPPPTPRALPEEAPPSEESVDVPDVTGEDVDPATTEVEDAGAMAIAEPDPGDAARK
jgi:hypothetical protein